jgi:RNA polymerase sigma-70 factor (ECF subfamily)
MLDNKYKEVIILYYYENLKIDDISKILKISPSAVKMRLARAKEKLRITKE